MTAPARAALVVEVAGSAAARSTVEADGVGEVVKTRAKRTTFRRTCPECGERFETHAHDRLFCTDAHKAAFHNRSSKIGRALVPIAMAWRLARNAKGDTADARAKRAAGGRALNELVALLDRACADDRETGRMSKLDYVMRRRLVQGFRFNDENPEWQAKEIERERAEKAAAKQAEKEPAK